jgi:hypothetical protein
MMGNNEVKDSRGVVLLSEILLYVGQELITQCNQALVGMIEIVSQIRTTRVSNVLVLNMHIPMYLGSRIKPLFWNS